MLWTVKWVNFYVFRVKSQLKRLARPMYSNPPIHGAKIVANVVGDPALFNEWKAEMEMMAGRIKNVRQKLYGSLSAKDKSGKDWSFILKQIGMFSFTGLNKAQVIVSSQFPSKLRTCGHKFSCIHVLLLNYFDGIYLFVISFICITSPCIVSIDFGLSKFSFTPQRTSYDVIFSSSQDFLSILPWSTVVHTHISIQLQYSLPFFPPEQNVQ